MLERVGHHTDYCFVPKSWVPALLNMQIGSADEWIGNARSEAHVPLVFDFDVSAVRDAANAQRRALANRRRG